MSIETSDFTACSSYILASFLHKPVLQALFFVYCPAISEVAPLLVSVKQQAGIAPGRRIKTQFFTMVLQTFLGKARIRSAPATTEATKAIASNPSPVTNRPTTGTVPHTDFPKSIPTKAQRILEM